MTDDRFASRGGFIRRVLLHPDAVTDHYPFTLPAVRYLAESQGLPLPPGVTFLTGENGSGKSTLLEAIAVAAGFNPHGESFVDLVLHRFGPRGLYLLDEPEAALSVRGCLAVLARFAELAAQGSQITVATHSPVLLALPDATILEIADDGTISTVDYDDALPVRLTRDFLAAPEKFLRHLLPDGR
ncbi:AAA family ATPase [Nocardia brasiliensis]|uniref:AAA family ATPase n=1 Tax=Nocardia brasiliensis TaxID=37326 RepID=UPI0037928E1B